MTYGYRLFVYRRDRRTKSGERLAGTYDYAGYSGNAMMDECKDLRQLLYRPEDGWRLDWEPMTVMVRSLMTGEMVEIDYRHRGTAMDPSQERYWSA